MSLRCAIAIAERIGEPRPDWELSLAALGSAIATREDAFLDKSRWAMDWYYPILGGVLRGEAARARIDARWDEFVVDGLGVRCVSDRPWITAAETCELVMALDAIGDVDRARQLLGWAQFLRHDDGSYWCGMNFEGERFDAPGQYFTADQPTWNSAAVVLATHALEGSGPTAGLFRGESLPPLALTGLERRLAAVSRILEHVMDREQPAGQHEPRPRLVVGRRHVEGVAAVDEQQAQRGAPVPGHGGGVADDRDDDVLQPGVRQGAPQERQGVHPAGARVDHLGVVVLPPGLVLLRAAVVVHGEQHGAGRPGRGAEVDRRLAAVRADLQQWAQPPGGQPCRVQGQPLVVGHEALGGSGELELLRVHGQVVSKTCPFPVH
jgi:hypothetical protein